MELGGATHHVGKLLNTTKQTGKSRADNELAVPKCCGIPSGIERKSPDELEIFNPFNE